MCIWSMSRLWGLVPVAKASDADSSATVPGEQQIPVPAPVLTRTPRTVTISHPPQINHLMRTSQFASGFFSTAGAGSRAGSSSATRPSLSTTHKVITTILLDTLSILKARRLCIDTHAEEAPAVWRDMIAGGMRLGTESIDDQEIRDEKGMDEDMEKDAIDTAKDTLVTKGKGRLLEMSQPWGFTHHRL
ncbi:hypothetical protein H0H92_007400 [Tricholoma furcatifolium]|nr:hypothetical protein H0H92_007400 [Tricholoma furcatifolium]